MALKKRNTAKDVSAEAAEALANEIADKPYGKKSKVEPIKKKVSEPGADAAKIVRTTITIPQSLMDEIDQQVLENKKNRISIKSTSAVVRDALEQYFK